MLYRQLRKRDTGQWVDLLLTVDGEAFSVPAESVRADIAAALGLQPADLEVVDSDSDLRTGAMLELPLPGLTEGQVARNTVSDELRSDGFSDNAITLLVGE